MADSNKLHVVIVPWLAFGHIIPFLELAKAVAQKGHNVSFICTPKNIKRLPRLPPHLSPLINLVSFPLPKIDDDCLPEDAEATVDIPVNLHPYLKKAYDGLEPVVSSFLESASPDWVIYDIVQHWLPPIAAKMGISCAYFGTFPAWSLVFMGPSSHMLNGSDPRKAPEDYLVSPEWVPFESTVSFRLHELMKMAESYKPDCPSGASEHLRMGLVITGCDAFLIRTCEELESDWLKVLGDIQQKTILPVGLLPPSAQDSTDEHDDTWQEISGWLDKQNKSSVVYVALGTEATPSQDELTELALGLELSRLPFFWTLRSRPGSTNRDSAELPDGFEERTKGRGVVWTNWVPQLRILAHNSVGGFLTHCGWNSIIEGLQQGLPLIMLPMIWDQGLNARALAEKNVGVEVPRNEPDGSLTRQSVAESINLVMVEERGRIYREKAREMSSIFGDMDLQERYLDNFVCYLQNHKRSHKSVNGVFQWQPRRRTLADRETSTSSSSGPVISSAPPSNQAPNISGATECLEWKIRFKVALGVAEGLQYLHCHCHRRIIHRDITASNILLTEDNEPQISDFGLAKWLPEKWIHHVVDPIEGTFGYMAPEYFMYGIVDEKTDVFAFGVLLLELITGRRAVDPFRKSLVMWAKPLLENNHIKDLADPKLGDAYDMSEMKRTVSTALSCLHHLPSMRPSMSRVVQMLRGESSSGQADFEQKSLGGKAIIVDACDREDYTWSKMVVLFLLMHK